MNASYVNLFSQQEFRREHMATEKTPIHKRIARAESSAAQWKMKAIERREAAEALKVQLETVSENIQIKNSELDEANKQCINLEKQVNELTEQLRNSDHMITKLRLQNDELKKNPYH